MVRSDQHRLALYPGPGSLFRELERCIGAARHRFWLATYIYRDDRFGVAFAQRLAAAAGRGVDVRLLYDPNGSRYTRRSFFTALRAQGVGVRSYRPWRLAPRDHGRLVVSDDAAFTGGVNWGSEWEELARGGAGWHDVSIGLQGPCVQDFRRVFLLRWAEADGRRGVRDYATGRAYGDVELVADSSSGPCLVYERLRDRVEGARKRVWIESAYCVPPPELLAALARAARRGVDVRLLVPARSDIMSLVEVARGEYRRWLERGIKVHEYRPAVLHGKFAVIDDDWATVGTFNPISTGLWWCNETNVIVHDAAFVRALAELYRTDLARSSTVDHAWLARRARWAGALETWLARLYRGCERGIARRREVG